MLYAHPAVQDAAVVGTPSALHGEDVVACVALHAAATVSPEELQAHCRRGLAPYKVPRAWKVVADFPRNALGKVTKKAVLAGFAR